MGNKLSLKFISILLCLSQGLGLGMPPALADTPDDIQTSNQMVQGLTLEKIIDGEDAVEAVLRVGGNPQTVRTGDAITLHGIRLLVRTINTSDRVVILADPEGKTILLKPVMIPTESSMPPVVNKNGPQEFSPTIGGNAPPFSYPLVATGQLAGLDAWKGKPILLFIWATWCPNCRSETPLVQRMHRQYTEKGLVVLGLEIGMSGQDAILNHIQKYQVTFPIMVADKSALQLYQVRGIPANIFIDRDGVIRGIAHGEINAKYMEYLLKRIL